MKKILKKKIGAFLFSLFMVLSILPMSTKAAEENHCAHETIEKGRCTQCKDYEVVINVAPSSANVTFYDSEDAVVTDVADCGVVENFHRYKLYVPEGRYHYTGVDTGDLDRNLGGMSFDVPFAEEILATGPESGEYSGKGMTMTLLRVNFYTTNKAITEIGDYEPVVMGGIFPTAVNGTQYMDENSRVVTPVMVQARGNACVYQISFRMGRRLAENYGVTPLGNVTFADSLTATASKTFTVTELIDYKVIAPSDATVKMFNQLKNFNVEEISQWTDPADNGDGTSTWLFKTAKNNSYLTYRVSKENEMTQAGWFKNSADTVNVTFSGDPKSTENKDLSFAVQNYMEASTLLNINGQNDLSLETGDTFRLRSYRGAWQIINNITANCMIEPDFHYEIISGGEHITLTPAANRCTGNAGTGMQSNWMDILGVSKGTAIVEVSYDAICLGGNGYTGTYGATDPTRTSLAVIQVGQEKGTLEFKAKGRDVIWDTEYDTVYTLEDTADFDFEVSLNEAAPEKVWLSADKGNTWKEISANADGSYHAAGMALGNNIFKFTTGEVTAYQVVRVDKVSYTVTNTSREGDVIYEGDALQIVFTGLHLPIPKFSGIYNPGFGSQNGHRNVYDCPADSQFASSGGQYDYITTNKITWTVGKPDENGKNVLTNGSTQFGVMGVEDPLGGHRLLTDNGTGTNFSAVNTNHIRNVLPDIEIAVKALPTAKVKLSVNAENPEILITNDRGNAAVTPNDAGEYICSAGSYSYIIKADGFVQKRGSFSVGLDEGDTSKEIQVTLEAVTPACWDGTSVTEPKTDDQGTYLIGTGAELAWFAQAVTGGKTGINVRLTADIELGYYPWIPIGTTSKGYAGHFDGDGHVIKDLYIESTAGAQGLFGQLNSGAVVSKLGVTGIVSTTGTYAGGIAGKMMSGSSVLKCYNAAAVTAMKNGGGIAGFATTGSYITDCYNAGNVTLTTQNLGGGITGGGANTSQCATMTNCYNIGTITASEGVSIGGVSVCNNATRYSNCYEIVNCCVGGKNYGKATQLSEEEMKALAPVLGTSFTADTTDLNGGYPVLSWQNTEPLSPEEVMELINAIGTPITMDSKTAIDKARAAYDLLSATDTGKVTNYSILTSAEGVYGKIKNAVDLIDAIGELSPTESSKTALQNAKNAYDALSETEKDAVTNQEVLKAAEESWEELMIPVEISTAEELMAFAEKVNETPRQVYLNARLTADIDMKDVAWTPIGGSSSTYFYKGTFDGNSHKIYHLKVDSNMSNQALFAGISATAVVENLTLKDSSIGGGTGCAGFVRNNYGTIRNCVNYADIKGTNGYIAGIAAANYGTIENCANFGTISGTYAIAGIAGSDSKGIIKNCYNAGNITASTYRGGGICGTVSSSVISNCYNSGEIKVPEGETAYEIANIVVTNCYGLKDDGTGYYQVITAEQLKSEEILTAFGEAYKADQGLINQGYPVLSWQNSVPELAAVKEAALMEIQDYKNNSAYRAEELEKLEAEKAAGILAVSRALDEEEVAAAVAKAKAAMDEIKTDNQLSKEEMEAVKAEAEAAKAAAEEAKTAAENAKEEAESAKAAAESAKAEAESAKAEAESAKAAAEAAKTDAEKAKAEAESAKAAAEAAKAEALAEAAAAATDRASAEEARKAAEEAKTAAENASKAAQDAQKAAEEALKKVQDALKEAETAKALVDAQIAGKKEIGAYKDLKNYRPTQQEVLNGIVDAAYEAIEAAKSTEEVTTAVAEAKAAVDAVKTAEEMKVPYEDVKSRRWYYDAVSYCYQNHLMNGVSETAFAPCENLTRAQFAVILYRMAGEPELLAETSFQDVTGTEWYAKAVLWAANAGVVSGYADGTYGADDPITREQIAVMMYRYGQYLQEDTSVEGQMPEFADKDQMGSYAADAVCWAVDRGILNGKEDGKILDPKGNTTRAEAAAIIERFVTNKN